MIKISYKDGQDWVNIDGEVRSWTNSYDMFKSGRVQASYLAPTFITDTWNGVIYDIQHVRRNVWFLEIFFKESELQEISKLQSCSTIVVKDLDNNLTHNVDMTSSELLVFSEPERIFDTSESKVIIQYQTKKTVINKGVLAPNQTNTLITSFDNGTSVDINTFYTDFVTIDEQQDTDPDTFSNDSGVNTLTKAISQKRRKVVFYMLIADANIFKREFERAQTITLNAVTVLENSQVEYTAIGEGLIKVVAECLIESEVSYPLDV